MAHVMQEAAHRKPIAPALPSASGAPKPHAPHTSIPYPILSASKIQAHTATREATKGEPAVVNLQRSAVLGVLYLKDHGNSSPPRRSGLAGTPHAHTQASGSATCSLPASMRVGGWPAGGWPAGGLQ
jgi:hypothetical protein